MNRLSVGILAVILAAGACRDVPSAPEPLTPPANGASRAQLLCSVDVAARTIRCNAPPSSPRGSIFLGGQGMHVRLASSNVQYSNGLLQAEVTVQNLLDQPMGTDGTTVSGTRVFFHSGPAVVEGTGSVSVQADSVGDFTAANQPYYVYDGVIQPSAVSAPRTWSFAVDSTVVRFEFMVLVETALPGERSILHWRAEQAPLPFAESYTDISAYQNAAFVAAAGKVLYFDGNVWTDLGDPGCTCGHVAAVSHDEAFVVGTAGAVRWWTGSEWVDVSSDVLSGAELKGVWGSSASDVWAISDDRMFHFDGTEWMEYGASLPQGGRVMAIWGSDPDNVWVVGLAGTIIRWNGQVWLVRNLNRGTDLLTVWGTRPNDVWAAGFTDCACGPGSAWHDDGTGWKEVTGLPGLEHTLLVSGESSGANDVWMVTYHGAVLHHDGAGWSNAQALPGVLVRQIASPAPGTAIALATEDGQDVLLRNDGGGWRVMMPPSEPLTGVWGSSANDVWAVGGGGSIRHRVDGTWTWQPTPGGIPLAEIWGASATDVWAVGDSGAAHFDGASWTRPAGAAIPLFSVWGSSATDVWAGGYQEVAHWDGASWAATPLPIGRVAGVWGSSAADVFAVGEDGQIRHWNGAWTPMASGTSVSLSGVWGSGPGDVYAIGTGTVLHYDGNAAGSWTAVATPASELAGIEAIWGSGPDDVFMLADDGASVVHWDGTAWRKLTTFSFAGARMLALWGSGPHDLYAAGDEGRVVHGTR